MITKLVAVLMLILPCGALAAKAQTPPDFNGTWYVQPGKHALKVLGLSLVSSRLNFQGPAVDEVVEALSGGDRRTYTLHYVTDGSETTNEFAGCQLISRAWWEGNRLVIEWQWKDSKSGIRRIWSEGGGDHRSASMLIQDFVPSRMDQTTVTLAKAH